MKVIVVHVQQANTKAMLGRVAVQAVVLELLPIKLQVVCAKNAVSALQIQIRAPHLRAHAMIAPPLLIKEKRGKVSH